MLVYEREINPVADRTLKYLYFMDKGHPLASKTGRVYLHRHVASMKYGRWTLPGEHVHHIDGNRQNNSAENLEIITAAEHNRRHRPGSDVSRTCDECGRGYCVPNKSRASKYCSNACRALHRSQLRLSAVELDDLVWAYPTSTVALMLGVSDTAISKRCRKLGVKKPEAGYWRRLERGYPVDRDYAHKVRSEVTCRGCSVKFKQGCTKQVYCSIKCAKAHASSKSELAFSTERIKQLRADGKTLKQLSDICGLAASSIRKRLAKVSPLGPNEVKG